MPKSFAQLNYYEMLDIEPDATTFDIRHAYNAALQVYQQGSLASYSFFSGDERQAILSLIEKAYSTLIHDQARKDYDEDLIRRGELDAEKVASAAVKKPVSIFDISRGSASGVVSTNNEALKSKISQSQLIGDILAQNELCGADLKKIRTELGVPIEQIAQETKIRQDHLRSIEEDHVTRLPAAVFLKGFVKSYLKCLCLEPVEELSALYMNTMARLQRK
ncbi:MAG TPA: helix-turn-helix domain-containing protein [Smithellaceae bacterium]|nr:helix-turn-helix domain-containing protein [Smithellaceae bacterium]